MKTQNKPTIHDVKRMLNKCTPIKAWKTVTNKAVNILDADESQIRVQVVKNPQVIYITDGDGKVTPDNQHIYNKFGEVVIIQAVEYNLKSIE
jgi:mannose-6-phosphate isomerase class I